MRLLALLPLSLLLATPPTAGALDAGSAPAQERGGGRGSQEPRPRSTPPQGPGAGRDAGRGADRRGAGDAAREQPSKPQVDMELGETYFRVADHDGDGWITWREARSSLRVDKHRFERIDADGDGLIDREEFLASYRNTVERLGAYPPPIAMPGTEGARLLEGVRPESQPALWPKRPAASVVELFGTVREREEFLSLVQLPPRIDGPVDAFSRLDVDRDGFLTDADLDSLQRPMQLLARRNTVMSSLDTNGDGVVDREEFYASMRGQRAIVD